MSDRKYERNRMHNAKNPCQGDFKKVLCVCSAGLLRSPTAAKVLGSEPFNFNTRAAGAEESFALIPVDRALLHWADEIVCMTKDHAMIVSQKFPDVGPKEIIVLDIEDDFEYMDPTLVKLIKERYVEAIGKVPGHHVNCSAVLGSGPCDCTESL